MTFRFGECWARDNDAKRIIKESWENNQGNVLKGIDDIRTSLGGWQYGQYRDRKGRINSLMKKIDNLIDVQRMENKIERLRESRAKLGSIYTSEEMYWAQRSRIKWIKEGDKNTRIFHVRAMHRAKKNFIEGLKDENGNWITDPMGMFNVSLSYFDSLLTRG